MIKLTFLGQPLIDLPDFVKTTEGKNFTKDCLFKSNDPNAIVKWTGYDEDEFLNPLKFWPISRNNTGNYTCIVESRGGNTSKVLRIVVQCK